MIPAEVDREHVHQRGREHGSMAVYEIVFPVFVVAPGFRKRETAHAQIAGTPVPLFTLQCGVILTELESDSAGEIGAAQRRFPAPCSVPGDASIRRRKTLATSIPYRS